MRTHNSNGKEANLTDNKLSCNKGSYNILSLYTSLFSSLLENKQLSFTFISPHEIRIIDEVKRSDKGDHTFLFFSYHPDYHHYHHHHHYHHLHDVSMAATHET